MNRPYIFAFGLGAFLVILVFVAYVFVIPPFYSLTISGETGTGSLYLDPDEQNLAFWSPEVGDFNYTISFSFASDETIEVVVYFDDAKFFTKNGTNISEVLGGESQLRLWWGGLESTESVWRAHDISIYVKNLSPENTRVSFSCSLISYGRASSVFLDLGFVVAGLFILITTIVQGIYKVRRRVK